jgi:hypothetical protein
LNQVRVKVNMEKAVRMLPREELNLDRKGALV